MTYFIQDMKAARGLKDRRKLAELFNKYYETITGEKCNITVSLNTDNDEYKKEA